MALCDVVQTLEIVRGHEGAGHHGAVSFCVFGNLIIVWYLALTIHVCYACMIWFVIPESLTKEKMAESKRLYVEELSSGSARSVSWVKRIFGFLAPLNVFLVQPKGVNPLKKMKGRWNLPLIAVSYGLTTMLYVSIFIFLLSFGRMFLELTI